MGYCHSSLQYESVYEHFDMRYSVRCDVLFSSVNFKSLCAYAASLLTWKYSVLLIYSTILFALFDLITSFVDHVLCQKVIRPNKQKQNLAKMHRLQDSNTV